MRCPFCHNMDTDVVDTRRLNDGDSTRRRRKCRACQRRFTTYERMELGLMVVKKSGEREPYDREKIVRGVYTACYRRPVSTQRIEQLVNEVEMLLRSHESREVSSSEIGDLVMQHLRELDEVAYIRFASVYLSFEDIGRLREAVEELMQQKQKQNGGVLTHEHRHPE